MIKLFTILFVLLISILSFELFLRYSPFSSGTSPVVYDKDIGMWHKKNFESSLVKECYNSRYSFDMDGKIKNNYPYNPQKKDIVLLGDSQVEALMVENDQIIHNSLYKAIKGQFNVLNYGLSGTGPAQHYQILQHKTNLPNTNSIIHFVFLENDLDDGDPKNFTDANRPKVFLHFHNVDHFDIIKPKVYDMKEKIRDFLGNFELYAYLKKSISHYSDSLTLPVNKKAHTFILNNEEFKWTQIEGSIYQINKLAQQNGISYTVVIYSSYEFSNNDSLKRKRFENFLNSLHIQYINLTPFLKNLEKKQPLGFECDEHWNAQTHKAIANYLKEKIQP